MAGNSAAVSLASNALVLLGHQSIASFTEETAGAQVAENLYEHSYKFLLSSHRWRFATTQKQLARLTASPEAVYKYQFQLPTDIVYLIRPISIANYEIYNDKLYCNQETATIEYVYNIPEDFIPSYFAKAVEFYLAQQFAIPITGDIDKASYYGQQFNAQMLKAKGLDSSQRPSSGFTYNPYTDIRG